MLLGNKCDIEAKRKVSKEIGEKVSGVCDDDVIDGLCLDSDTPANCCFSESSQKTMGFGSLRQVQSQALMLRR